ncbi:DUF1707 and DUF4190 domain-containing protein [Actinoplanes teichomyceticus]|uniref:Uncharacterized protein DUF1707 n=1 Tax=Actinoplanes teichomyceticus TaxID=1867 RepID=A0A561WJX4_ACTTI|nr:DUF1707 and DUF4190 domain-containing protein [Actinoplanes teichomyceticus]TWG24171.1 uncharacterized protein DUF1707 [Actinoplanes teichomyceticus]GIF12984.1 hypothetical protein Ate01nite_30160 [Actinoplanes teichomyceticus]
MYRSPHVRVSDADRETIVARLSTATAEGRLTIDEFSERSRQAYAARTWGELSAVVHDLPAPGPAHPVKAAYPPAPAGSRLPLLAMIFGLLGLPLVPCGGFGLGVISGIAGIVLGVQALKGPADQVPHGRGMAITGVACGAAGVLIPLLVAGLLFTIDI